MPRAVIRSVKNATIWDNAYVCCKNKGNCLTCPMFTGKNCSFALFCKNGSEGDRFFETRKYFTDDQKEDIYDLYIKIVKDKETKYENNLKK